MGAQSSSSRMSETDSHSNILAEIAAIKKQIHDIKKKRDIKTPSYPFTVGRAAARFKSQNEVLRVNPQLFSKSIANENVVNGTVNRNVNGKPAVSPRPALTKQRTIELDDRGNLKGEGKDCMKELADQKIVVNVRGKGKSGIDQTSQMANLEFGGQGNLLKEDIPTTRHSHPAQRMNYIANAVLSQSSWNNAAPHPGYYGMPQLTTQMLASSVQATNARVEPVRMGNASHAMGNNSSVTIVENGQMNNYIIPNPVSRTIPVAQQPIQAQYAKPQDRVVQPFLQNLLKTNALFGF